MLKKFISILLPVIFIFSGTEMHQFLKLPVLIHHFLEHKKSDADMSFITFIEMHYNDHNEQAGQEDHHKLPFKHCGGGINHIVIGEVDQFETHFNFHITAEHRASAKYREDFYSSSISNPIWQPPKSA